MTASHIKRLSTAHAFVRSAAGYLQPSLPTGLSLRHVPLQAVEATLSASVLIAHVEELAAVASTEVPRAGFWRNLEQACATLDRADLARSFRARFVAMSSNRPGEAVVQTATCAICGRALDRPTDPLSLDCGGDCWGCIGDLEARAGHPPSLARVREEAALGLRPDWVEDAGR